MAGLDFTTFVVVGVFGVPSAVLLHVLMACLLDPGSRPEYRRRGAERLVPSRWGASSTTCDQCSTLSRGDGPKRADGEKP